MHYITLPARKSVQAPHHILDPEGGPVYWPDLSWAETPNCRIRVTLATPWQGSEYWLKQAVLLAQEWNPETFELERGITGRTRSMCPPPNDPECPWGTIVRIDEVVA